MAGISTWPTVEICLEVGGTLDRHPKKKKTDNGYRNGKKSGTFWTKRINGFSIIQHKFSNEQNSLQVIRRWNLDVARILEDLVVILMVGDAIGWCNQATVRLLWYEIPFLESDQLVIIADDEHNSGSFLRSLPSNLHFNINSKKSRKSNQGMLWWINKGRFLTSEKEIHALLGEKSPCSFWANLFSRGKQIPESSAGAKRSWKGTDSFKFNEKRSILI